MPQFKVAKTDNIIKLNNNKITEDKLYIYKETNKFGRLFYDFEDGARIEVGSLNNVYDYSREILDLNIVVMKIEYLDKCLPNGSLTFADSEEIKINDLVVNFKSIYSVRDIDRINRTVTLIQIYRQEDLKWNDYYE